MQEDVMNTPAKPELEQLVETFRAATEEDVTEPLLPRMQKLAGKLDRRCSAYEAKEPSDANLLNGPIDHGTGWWNGS
jgi:hypothetical protein